jgi:hypothetical protein
MSGPFKMKGWSPFKQEETKTSGDNALKRRFGTGWKKARDDGWTVVNGKVVPPPSKDKN